jgi:hypothetical protein
MLAGHTMLYVFGTSSSVLHGGRRCFRALDRAFSHRAVARSNS